MPEPHEPITPDAPAPHPQRATISRRTKWTFAVGTLGKDMVYALQSMFLVVFLTEAMHVSNWVLGAITIFILAIRLVDAIADVIIGAAVDSTRTKWGPYKPWILGGIAVSGLATILLFTDLNLPDTTYVAAFCLVYLVWCLSFSAGDIPYWSLVPGLTRDQRERESMSALTKLFATVGLFVVVVGIVPITQALGGGPRAWTLFAVASTLVMWLGQAITLVGVQQDTLVLSEQHAKPREIADAVLKNDQLLWTALAMILFQTGYVTTTSFGLYFFKYAYGDEGMYSPFAAVLGVGMILGYALFPVVRRRFSRRRLYTASMLAIVAAYVVFFLAPMNMVVLCLCGLTLFVADSFIVILMIGFITDCVEYGQWKLGARHSAVTFAVQPFINKVGGALAQAILGVTLVVTGINGAATPADVTPAGIWGMKAAMLVLPPILILTGYLIYRRMFVIDEATHARIVADLRVRDGLDADR